jgi:DNA ligase-1
MLFSKLVDFFGQIEATTLRNEKTLILSQILKEAEQGEVDKLVYLALGGLRPAFDRLEFQMADKMILRALGKTEKEYQEVGDIGELAQYARQPDNSENQIIRRSENQSVREVYEKLEKIASASGAGSQERKVAGLAKLISEVNPEDVKYIVRIVSGRLRLGFSDKTVIDALSYFENGTKEYSDDLDKAYQKRPDVGYLARQVKELGVVEAVRRTDVAIGTPIVPALAQRLKTPKEMIEKMGKVIVEKKFDGTRVQIHFSRVKRNEKAVQEQASMFEEEKPKFFVRTFTRNLDESSEMFPELTQISEQINADEVILDCEAVGYDPKTLKLVPFQLTITRKRKHGIEEASSTVPLRFFVFDIMYKDGQSLIGLPLHERRKILAETIKEEKVLVVDDFIETDDPDVLREYHKTQLAAGLEGALVKQIDGQYMPGRTGFNWVKFKESEDSRAKLSDTIDCVIMGYYKGLGKRSGFELGAFLVGIKSGEKILTLAKVGTGISDEQFKELGERLKKYKIESTKCKEFGYEVPKILEPDVWVEPKVMVEVAADEITVSPTHSAGYALRFPRMVKFRDDKSSEQATTLQEVKTMFGI